jgi:predicted DNA-binding transcriptional regulator AlpA
MANTNPSTVMLPRGNGTDATQAVAPLLVPADVAGPMCGRSVASWWRDHAAGRIPAPVKLGGRTLWRVAELRAWVEAGCPDRRTWEALRRSKGGLQ